MPSKPNQLAKKMRILSLFFAGLMLLYAIKLLSNLTVDDILHLRPDNLFLAAAAIIGLYLLKSFSFFFPLAVLYVSTGIIFPFYWAVLVNLAGVGVCFSLPYTLGRFAGKGFVDILMSKYPKAERIKQLNINNQLFSSFFLRVISVLPGDVVSLFLGAMGVSYAKYLLGSVAGVFPSLLAVTIMGTNINNPTSPAFIFGLAAKILITAASSWLYRRYTKKVGTETDGDCIDIAGQKYR